MRRPFCPAASCDAATCRSRWATRPPWEAPLADRHALRLSGQAYTIIGLPRLAAGMAARARKWNSRRRSNSRIGSSRAYLYQKAAQMKNVINAEPGRQRAAHG